MASKNNNNKDIIGMDAEVTSPSFSIDSLLKAAGVKEKDFASFKAFLEWAKVDEDSLDQLTKDSLKELVEEYNTKEDPKFTLGLYAGKLVDAASNWGKGKGKRTKGEELEVVVKRLRIEEQTNEKEEEPKFTVNGEIKDPAGYFFLEPKQTNKGLVAAINKGDYVMLQGHRGSGKTTRCLYAIQNQVTQYTCIWITMQAGMTDSNSVETFWVAFGERLMKKAKTRKLDSSVNVKDQNTFVKFFEEQQDKGNRIVLFLDEFDLLLDDKALASLKKRQEIVDQGHDPNAPEVNKVNTPLDSLLNALRGMKSERFSTKGEPAVYALQACVIIGPLSILQAANTRLSPFNISESMQAPYFSEDDTILLFQQFQDKTGKQLEQGIVEDIFARTQGHPGLTCYCGKRIHEDLAFRKSRLTFSEWEEFALFTLPKVVPDSWATIGRLQDTIGKEPYFSFLIRYFMRSSQARIFDDVGLTNYANALTSEGALKKNADGSYEISSILIRAIIMRTISSKKKTKVPQFLPLNDGNLDVPKILELALPCFDAPSMVSAIDLSHKENRSTKIDEGTKLMAKEECYHLELVSILRQWLPADQWAIATQVNAKHPEEEAQGKEKKGEKKKEGKKEDSGKKKERKKKDCSCDMVISSLETNYRCAVELCAHLPDNKSSGASNSVEYHYEKAVERYSFIKHVKEVWVVNFTTRQPDKGYLWPESNSKIHAAHVWHDLKWTQALLVLDSNKNTPIPIKLQ